MAVRTARADFGAGWIPSAPANWIAASNVTIWGTATASIRAHKERSLGGHAVIAKSAGVNARRHEVASARVHFRWKRFGRTTIIEPVFTFGQ